jgi:hypothetical protein
LPEGNYPHQPHDEHLKWSGRQFEPEARPCIDAASAGVTSHIASHEAKTRLEGWEVIEAWPGLPEALRAAILAIVRSTRAGKEGR